jgi:hypothetical protein
MGLIILVALVAHCTPTLTSCNGVRGFWHTRSPRWDQIPPPRVWGVFLHQLASWRKVVTSQISAILCGLCPIVCELQFYYTDAYSAVRLHFALQRLSRLCSVQMETVITLLSVSRTAPVSSRSSSDILRMFSYCLEYYLLLEIISVICLLLVWLLRRINLGLLLDHKLLFTTHLTNVTQKATGAMVKLSCCSHVIQRYLPKTNSLSINWASAPSWLMLPRCGVTHHLPITVVYKSCSQNASE